MKEVSIFQIMEIRRRREELKDGEVIYIKRDDNNYYQMTEEEISKFEGNMKNKSSICFDCVCARPGACPKMFAKGYRRLEKFSFTNVAIEMIAKELGDCNVVILECKKFKESR